MLTCWVIQSHLLHTLPAKPFSLQLFKFKCYFTVKSWSWSDLIWYSLFTHPLWRLIWPLLLYCTLLLYPFLFSFVLYASVQGWLISLFLSCYCSYTLSTLDLNSSSFHLLKVLDPVCLPFVFLACWLCEEYLSNLESQLIKQQLTNAIFQTFIWT